MLASLACLAVACSDPPPEPVGVWVSEKSSLVRLHLYADGVASLSSTGFLNLKWKSEGSDLVRIEALDRKAIFDLKLKKDRKGWYGTLELAGFDTLVLRKM